VLRRYFDLGVVCTNLEVFPPVGPFTKKVGEPYQKSGYVYWLPLKNYGKMAPSIVQQLFAKTCWETSKTKKSTWAITISSIAITLRLQGNFSLRYW